MIPILASLLLALGLGIFAYPLLRRSTQDHEVRTRDELTGLQERYRNALADLQDADTDWEIGNLSEADYTTARTRHRRVAAEALRGMSTLSDERERIREELAREIASATSSNVPASAVRRPSTNGVHHDAAEVVPLAVAMPRRRVVVPTPLIVGFGATMIAVAAIAGLYVRIQDVQASQAPLSTLPINHAHTVLLGETGEILVGHHDGLLQSRDGRTWQPALPAGDVMAIVRAPGARAELVLGHDVLLIQDAPGAPWRTLAHDLPGTDVHAAGTGTRGLYAYVEGLGLFLSRDGQSWEMIGAPLREGVAGGAVMPGSEADDVFVVAGSVVLRTRDGGRTWATAAGAVSMVLGGLAQAVAADPGAELVYAGTTDGLYRSADRGASWTKLPFRGSVVAVAGRGERVAVVDSERNFYLSHDGGGSWTAR